VSFVTFHPGKSSMLFLLMLDIEPGDITCIYSTMMYVSEHVAHYNAAPGLTFHQPLWFKAQWYKISVLKSEDSVIRSIVLHLGGIHTQMSYLGAIGHIMSGSGLHELLETVYTVMLCHTPSVARQLPEQFVGIFLLVLPSIYSSYVLNISKTYSYTCCRFGNYLLYMFISCSVFVTSRCD
jgi:hypothetical protein